MLAHLVLVVLLPSLAISAEITNLPGQPPVSFKQYAGYINLPGTEKNIFYWFQESQANPESDPVALWTNGGPGCSGLAGALIEQGAFRIQQNQSLSVNPGAWNQIANMLFIEQPVGVGFSYSNNSNDYTTGDAQAAEDMYNFILQFFAQDEFKSFAHNDFYITSESYGGHYMPTLAKYIVDHNKNGDLKFKGFLVGNPLTDMVENAKGMYDTWYGHQILPLPMWKEWVSSCSDGANMSDYCNTLEDSMNNIVSDLIYPYGIDWPVCPGDAQYHSTKHSLDRWFLEKVVRDVFGRPIPEIPDASNRRRLNWDACQVDYLSTYLNTPAVQQALHANVGTKWAMCTGKIKYNSTDIATPMEPYYTYLIEGGYGLNIAIYSGDDDSVCGTLGTQSWIWNMGWEVEKSWTDWEIDGQNGGYVVQFKDAIDFITIHSAGHQVPWFKPMKGFQVFQKYLKGVY